MPPLPPSYVPPGPGQPVTGQFQAGGWAFQILPYIEQDAVWKGGGAPTIAACQVAAMTTPIKYYFCPSRRAPQVHLKSGFSLIDYAASCATDPSGSPITSVPVSALCPPGLVGIHLPEIKDGASNTLMISEKRVNIAFLGTGQNNTDDVNGYTAGWCADTIRFTHIVPPPSTNPTGGLPPQADYNDSSSTTKDGGGLFGSAHANGILAAMCD